jgi:ABC-type uncharacterized transport system substrate-binding protein
MTRRLGLKAALAACLAGLFSPALVSPALAHPHVWVTAKAEIVFAPDGRVTGIRHAWTFDEAYTAYVTQGLDRNNDGKLTPDELTNLAKENTESLVDFDYFTVLKTNGAKQPFAAPRDYSMAYENEEVTLTYLLPLQAPANAGKALTLEITDPTYFVAFALAEGQDAVKLAGAPKGCATNISRPKPLDPAQQQKLSEAFFDALTAASEFGAQFANRAIVACP